MIKKFIKTPISEEFSEKGGATIKFVDTHTVPLDTSIQEAKDGLYVLGDAQLIKQTFIGLFKSMTEGVQRDGKPRTLADFLTIRPVFKGEVDLDKGYDPAKNDVRIAVQLLNEMELDIKGWTFQDVTPGRTTIIIDSVSDGTGTGVVTVGKAIEINGRGLPKTGDIAVDWAVKGTTQSGRFPADKVTSDGYRADIAAEATAALPALTADGEIVLTVRGNYANAPKTAVLAASTRPRITAVQAEGLEPGQVKVNVATHVTCYNATNITKAEIAFTDPDGASDKITLTPTDVTPEGFDYKILGGPAKEAVNNPKLVVTTPKGTAEFAVEYV